MTLWGGRVGRPLDPAVAAFLRADDAELLPYDCEATAIHARRLHAAGILDDGELADAERLLHEIPGNSLSLRPEDEDVHSALEDVVLTKDEARIKRGLEQRWTELVYEGLWFSPAREAIDAFVDRTQELVDGEVRVELRPNAAVVTGRRSPHMLYAEQLASYGTGETFPHAAAEGFIRIASLEVELATARKRAKTKSS